MPGLIPAAAETGLARTPFTQFLKDPIGLALDKMRDLVDGNTPGRGHAGVTGGRNGNFNRAPPGGTDQEARDNPAWGGKSEFLLLLKIFGTI